MWGDSLSNGEILTVVDHGSMWEIRYQPESGGLDTVWFDWRCLAEMYEAESGSSFYKDYAFGQGASVIQEYFKGRRIEVDGEQFNETVRLLD